MSGCGILFANVDAFRHASEHLQRSGSLSQNWFLFIAIVGIVLFWVGLYYWDKWRKQFTRLNKRLPSLYLELCDAHNLSRAERALLLKAAETTQLKPSSRLFIDSSVIRGVAGNGGPDASAYRSLLEKLFGDYADAPCPAMSADGLAWAPQKETD